MVLIIGNADTPLENHLYSVSYDRPNSEITRLTREGFDHSKIRVSIQAKLFISTYSNVQTPLPVRFIGMDLCSFTCHVNHFVFHAHANHPIKD